MRVRECGGSPAPSGRQGAQCDLRGPVSAGPYGVPRSPELHVDVCHEDPSGELLHC